MVESISNLVAHLKSPTSHASTIQPSTCNIAFKSKIYKSTNVPKTEIYFVVQKKKDTRVHIYKCMPDRFVILCLKYNATRTYDSIQHGKGN